MKIIYYWCPYFSKIATEKAVINSIKSINRYSKNKYKPILINAVGEWDWLKEENTDIEIYELTKFKLIKYLPREGFIFSRFTNIIIFLACFFPLLKFLKKNADNYFIIHLITSLPIFLTKIFNIKTKIILRISGLPKMNLLRKSLWKLSNKNLFRIICPTIGTKKYLERQKIFDQNKLKFLRDPVFSIKEINNKKKEKINLDFIGKKELILSIGRLTKQKNFNFLIECFKKLVTKFPNIYLVILGDGEKKKILEERINFYKLNDSVKLLGYQKNVFPFINKCKFFVSTSLWEDPGFVIIEAAATNAAIISSDCENGPKDFIENNMRGFSFKSNDKDSFLKTFSDVFLKNEKIIFEKKVRAKKESRLYSSFNHFCELTKIFS